MIKFCDDCEKKLDTPALIKKWRDISFPLVLCQKCKEIYTRNHDKPFRPKSIPNRRCMLCGKRKRAYDYWETESGQTKPVCRKCHDLYYEVKE